MAKVSVIIPAAGKGERFGGGEKKTCAKLDGRPIFLRTIEAFLNREDVAQIILAVAPEDLEQMKTQFGANLGFMGVKLVQGGDRRVDTVRAALAAVAEGAEFVAVHDAARPCVTGDWIDAVFAEAAKAGAAILAAPLVGTIKRVGPSKVIDQTISRENLYEAQTPQVFRKDLLVAAYQKLDEAAGTHETIGHDLTEARARARVDASADSITDDAQVVERTGHPISVVISDHTNVKITTRGDLTLAGAILKSRPAKTIRKMGAFEEAQW
jgi:2-C-methyl-D-erythritol 4-phosphate cytidylyltransferase